MSPDKRDRPLTISHLSVGMDDATGLLGGEVVEIGAPVRVRHGPDRIARLPLPSSGGDCESATQHRHSGERPLESEVWTRTDVVSSWRKMTPGRGIQEKDRGRQALTSGCGAGCRCGTVRVRAAGGRENGVEDVEYRWKSEKSKCPRQNTPSSLLLTWGNSASLCLARGQGGGR